MAFTEELWAGIADGVFPAILEHPFVAGLTSGELDEAAFRHYVVQDALYLKDFARGLALLAAAAPDDDALMMFCGHASNAILVERALHAGFLEGWGLSMEDVEDARPAPNCLLYTSFLLRTVRGQPYPEALCAFLPCYWIYWETGKALAAQNSPHPLYQSWIDTYAGDAFATVVQEMLTVVNAACQDISDARRAQCAENFHTAATMEWMFWDMGYRQQEWPV